jgi:hypothetical protein
VRVYDNEAGFAIAPHTQSLRLFFASPNTPKTQHADPTSHHAAITPQQARTSKRLLPHRAAPPKSLSLVYWGFSFKSTGGVTRDPFFKFDISTPAKIWRDTPEISAFPTKISAFLCLSGHFSCAVTSGRFDKGRGDA